MIGGLASQGAFVHREFHHGVRRSDPYAVESEDGPFGRKGCEVLGMTEHSLYPQKRPAPQQPLIHIAHQHTVLRPNTLQDPLHLLPPLGGT